MGELLPNQVRDHEWLTSLKNGCQSTFTEIYNEYWYPLFLFAYRKTEIKEVAEEIVQEIFTRLWKDRAKLEVINFSAYLFSSVRFEVVDHIRKSIQKEGYQKYCESFRPYAALSTEDMVHYNDLLSNFNQAVLQLPDKTREVYHLSRMEHWPVSKIAKHLSISEKTVEYHLGRATRYIKTTLREHTTGSAVIILDFINNLL